MKKTQAEYYSTFLTGYQAEKIDGKKMILVAKPLHLFQIRKKVGQLCKVFYRVS
jgi:hypothetical protein